jgi:hypothetical protein
MAPPNAAAEDAMPGLIIFLVTAIIWAAGWGYLCAHIDRELRKNGGERDPLLFWWRIWTEPASPRAFRLRLLALAWFFTMPCLAGLLLALARR